MIKENLKKELKSRMEGALKVLGNELKGLRTGRASVNLLDPVVVEAYGSKMHLSQVATISTPDSKTITVQVWDQSMTKTVEKAIADSNIGLNPVSDGGLVRMTLPPLNEDRRKDLVKLAHKYGENTKVSIRNVRRDGMEDLKKMQKANEISEDEQRSIGEEVQKLTDEFIASIDSQVKQKEQEILTI